MSSWQAGAALATERLAAHTSGAKTVGLAGLDQIERDLLAAKRQLLRSRGTEDALREIDQALCDPAILARPRPAPMPAALAALLPAPALFKLLSSQGRIASDEDGFGLAHWLVDLMSSYALLPLPGSQMGLWGGDPLESLTQALAEALRARPQLCQELDDDGKSPTHSAVYLLSLEALPLLLGAGADPSHAGADGVAAMDPDAFRAFISKAPKLPQSAERSARMLALLERFWLDFDIGEEAKEGSSGSGRGRL